MKIACIAFTDFPEGSGQARRLHMIGKGFAQLGHEVHIVIPQRFRPGPLHQEFDGLRVHWAVTTTPDTWGKLSVRLSARRATLRLINNIAAEGLDWLLLSNPSLDGLAFLLAARRQGARVMATYDDLRARFRHPTWRERVRQSLHGMADRLIPRLTQLNIPTTTFLEERIRSIAPHTPTFILTALVDPDRFQRQPEKAEAFRAKWDLGSAIVISYLGTFWHVDGVGNLLRAASQLLLSGEQFKLAISGVVDPGLEHDDVPALAQEYGLQRVAVQTGWLLTDDVVAAMSAADILVVPKLDDIANVAGMPVKLAEYLAMGRSVVASRVGDIPLYLADHEDAILCTPGDPHSLAKALRELIHDVPLRSKLAANARLAAEKHFDYRKVVARLESAMDQTFSQT